MFAFAMRDIHSGFGEGTLPGSGYFSLNWKPEADGVTEAAAEDP